MRFSAQHDTTGDGTVTDYMPRVLIIAYGNPLRSDDGVAWRVAEMLQNKTSPAEIEITCLTQLAPELAETASQFQCVIFVDAVSSPQAIPGEIRVEELGGTNPSDSATHFSHVLSPHAVIRLAETLYHAKPQAFAVTVVGEKFDHGEGLSPAVASVLQEVVARIAGLVCESSDPLSS